MVKSIKNKLIRLLNKISNKAPSHSLRLISVEGSPSKMNTEIRYQVCGTLTTAQEKIGRVVEDLISIKGFSKNESEIILSLFIEEKTTPTLEITHIFFFRTGVEFKIRDIESNIFFVLPPSSIFENESILNKFCKNDIIKIYHVIAESEIKNEVETRARNKSRSARKLHIIK